MPLLGKSKLNFSNVRDSEYFRYVIDIDSSLRRLKIVFETGRWGFQNYVEMFLNMKKRKVCVAEEDYWTDRSRFRFFCLVPQRKRRIAS